MRHRTPNPQPHSIQMHSHIVFKCAIHKEQGHLIDEGAPDHKLATILGTLHQHFRPLQLVSGKGCAISCFTNYHPPALHSSLSPSTFLPFPLAFLLSFPPPSPSHSRSCSCSCSRSHSHSHSVLLLLLQHLLQQLTLLL